MRIELLALLRVFSYWRLEEEVEYDEVNTPLVCVIQSQDGNLQPNHISCRLENPANLATVLEDDEKLVSNVIHLKSHRKERLGRTDPVCTTIKTHYYEDKLNVYHYIIVLIVCKNHSAMCHFVCKPTLHARYSIYLFIPFYLLTVIYIAPFP